MLVDLGRNDLGRVCEYGTVKVSDFFTIERYSHVMHIVSHVEGKMRPELTAFDLVRDASCHLSIPVVLEGHVRQPAEVSKAFDFGAYAVVVGKAITDIEWLVGRFAAAVPKRRKACDPACDSQTCIYRSQGLR